MHGGRENFQAFAAAARATVVSVTKDDPASDVTAKRNIYLADGRDRVPTSSAHRRIDRTPKMGSFVGPGERADEI